MLQYKISLTLATGRIVSTTSNTRYSGHIAVNDAAFDKLDQLLNEPQAVGCNKYVITVFPATDARKEL